MKNGQINERFSRIRSVLLPTIQIISNIGINFTILGAVFTEKCTMEKHLPVLRQSDRYTERQNLHTFLAYCMLGL